MTKEYHPANPCATTKICTVCTVEMSSESFYANRRICKTCYYEQRLAHANTVVVTSKFCRGCSTEKPIDDFTVALANTDGHVPRCRECCNKQDREQRKKWKKLNPVKARLKYQKDHENAKEHRNAMSREWHKKHPEFAIEKEARRRARMYKVGFEEVDYNLIIKRCQNWCYICKKPILPEQKTHFDHVVPLARHGSHTTDNIMLTHAICNLRKHDLLFTEMTDFQRRGP